MSDEIPQWALERAAELANKEAGDACFTAAYMTKTNFGRAFASYIAQHEEPPVDPVVQAAAKLREDYFNNYYMTTREAFEAAVRRGIELGKAGAA